MTTHPLGFSLLGIARNAIAHEFGAVTQPVIPHPELSNMAATFVTLTANGDLRGCIGSLDAYRPLAIDVARNAQAAAFHDPRFPPLEENELETIRIEISLLDSPEPLPVQSEAHAIAQLNPGLDGLILKHGNRHATFLPQVWENIQTPEQFIRELKVKAGLPPDLWDDQIELTVYRVQKWKEHS